MRNSLLILSLVALTAPTAMSRSLNPDEALGRALSQARKVAPRSELGSRSAVVADPVLTIGGEDSPAIYVFNKSDKGFLIVSADDVAAPILGYSDSETFNSENIPDNLKGWLEACGDQIRRASEAGLEAYFDTREEDHDPIDPLMSTKWEQTAPFNNDCPTLNGKTCVTGCVATAMAQVMKYHNWPQQVADDAVITYSWKTGQQNLTADFSNYEFDWENMLDSYKKGYDDTQASAVAKLMQACGYSVDMNYGTEASGAVNTFAGKALAQYFKYDQGLHNEPRALYSANEWENLIYDNLRDYGPTIYWGGIHCFVCDGYQGDGYFHFNWGWAGDGDGWFLLNALNPTTIGTGGSAAGYNSDQGALLGIKPAGDVPSERKYTFYTTGLSKATAGPGTYLNVWGEFQNYSPYIVEAEWVYQIYSEDGTEYIGTAPCSTPSAGKHTFSPDLNQTWLAGGILTALTKDGVTYRIYPAVRVDDKEYIFQCPKSMPAYVLYLRTRENNVAEYSAKLPEVGKKIIRDLSTNGYIYSNQSTIKISGIAEFTGEATATMKLTFRLQSKEDNTWYVGDDLTVEFTPEGQPFNAFCKRGGTSGIPTGDYTLYLSYIDTNVSTTDYQNMASCDVTIVPSAASKYSPSSFEVANAEAVDPNNIKISVEITGESGYAYEDLLFRIFDSEDTKIWEAQAPLYVTAPGSTIVSTTASLPDAIPGATYSAKAFKQAWGSWVDLTNPVPFTIAKQGTTGISEALTDNSRAAIASPNPATDFTVISAPAAISQLSLFTLSGQQASVNTEINGQSAQLDLTALANGLYIARISTPEGTYSIKIIKK
ncbi:MAG: thiol protease/hemagglutinin PrtT [Muribaculaceae bacterium]|nr:thiol protease/hemagglutinin PrtT [Muribaculaceae bacterium]